MLALLVTAALQAQTIAADEHSSSQKSSHLEAGFSLGSPAILNAAIGGWIGPIGIRFSGAEYNQGAQVNLVYKLREENNVSHSLALILGRVHRIGTYVPAHYRYASIVYEYNFKGVFVQAGPSRHDNGKTKLKVQIGAMLQLIGQPASKSNEPDKLNTVEHTMDVGLQLGSPWPYAIVGYWYEETGVQASAMYYTPMDNGAQLKFSRLLWDNGRRSQSMGIVIGYFRSKDDPNGYVKHQEKNVFWRYAGLLYKYNFFKGCFAEAGPTIGKGKLKSPQFIFNLGYIYHFKLSS